MDNLDYKKKKHHSGLIFIIVLLVLSFVIVSGYFYYIYPEKKADFYENLREEEVIPSIKEGYIPQGIAYDEKSDSIFISSYRALSQSRIDIIKDGKVRTVKLNDEKGFKLRVHSGGIAVNDEYVYVAGSTDNCVFVFKYDDIIKCNDKGKVNAYGRYMVGSENDKMRVSFLCIIDNELYCGEYSRNNTLFFASHRKHFELTKDGMKGGTCVSIPLNKDEEFGLEKEFSRVYIIPDNVQGMCGYNGKLFVSISNFILDSKILAYDLSRIYYNGDKEIYGQKCPLYLIDSSSLISETTLAPMSEQIYIKDGRMYICFESGAYPYVFLVHGVNRIVSFDISYFIKNDPN